MDPRASAAWRLVFRVLYRLVRLLDPLVRSAIALGLPGLDGIVGVSMPGRSTGRPRRTLLTLLRVDEAWYIGHPNGDAAWTRNAEAAGWVEIDPPGAAGPRFGVRRLPAGPERDAVIRATRTQQPFPANVLYRAAARHIAAVGVYFRLEPTARVASDSESESGVRGGQFAQFGADSGRSVRFVVRTARIRAGSRWAARIPGR